MSSCGLLSDIRDQVILGSYFWDFPWNHMDKNYVFTWKMRISCVFFTSGVGTLRKVCTSACLVKAGYLMDWIAINQNFFSSAIIYKWKRDHVHIVLQDYPKGRRCISGSSCDILESEWAPGLPWAVILGPWVRGCSISPFGLQDRAGVGLTVKPQIACWLDFNLSFMCYKLVNKRRCCTFK